MLQLISASVTDRLDRIVKEQRCEPRMKGILPDIFPKGKMFVPPVGHHPATPVKHGGIPVGFGWVFTVGAMGARPESGFMGAENITLPSPRNGAKFVSLDLEGL